MKKSPLDVESIERCDMNLLDVVDLCINKVRLLGEAFFSNKGFKLWTLNNPRVVLIK